MFTRQKVATVVAEFLGTGVLTLVFLSVLRSQLALGFFIALAAGLAIAVMSFTVGKLSGGYFNPALTLGAWTARQVSTVSAVLYIAAQMLGAWAAYGLFTYMISGDLPESKTNFSGEVMVAEIVGTAVLAMTWAGALAYQRVSAVASASMAGASYVVSMLLASVALGLAFLNPALALGARAWGDWKTYVLGPVVGAVVGFGLYQLLFATAGATQVVEPAKAAATPAKRTVKPAPKKSATKAVKSTAKKATRRKK